jgi:hypothetical protein
MCKEWRNTSKRAEPAKGGSQGVGGAKSTSVVTPFQGTYFRTYGHARLQGHQRGSYLLAPRKNTPPGCSPDEQVSLQHLQI